MGIVIVNQHDDGAESGVSPAPAPNKWFNG